VADSFTHLHVHTEFRWLDGASRVDEVVAAAAADGAARPGDHRPRDSTGSSVLCRLQEGGITPVNRFEAYQAFDSRFERINTRRPHRRHRRRRRSGKRLHHLTLRPRHAGYRTDPAREPRFLEGYYRKPKVDWDLLDDHSEGVIATSGCLGDTCAVLARRRLEARTRRAGRLQGFGQTTSSSSCRNHGIGRAAPHDPQLVEIFATKLGAPILATNDSHSPTRRCGSARTALLCVQTTHSSAQSGDERSSSPRRSLPQDADEMRRLFKELPEACDNTCSIAQRPTARSSSANHQLPKFDVPAGFESDSTTSTTSRWKGEAAVGSALTDTSSNRLA